MTEARGKEREAKRESYNSAIRNDALAVQVCNAIGLVCIT